MSNTSPISTTTSTTTTPSRPISTHTHHSNSLHQSTDQWTLLDFVDDRSSLNDNSPLTTTTTANALKSKKHTPLTRSISQCSSPSTVASSSTSTTVGGVSSSLVTFDRVATPLQGYLLKHNITGTTSAITSSVSAASNVAISFPRKKRWFVFSPVTGKLYYYRTREDAFPIGEIDIRSASFVIKSPTTHQQSSNSVASSVASALRLGLSNSTANNSGAAAAGGVGGGLANVTSSSSTSTNALTSSFVFEIVTGSKRLTLEANNAADGFHWIKNLQIYRHHLCNRYLGIENVSDDHVDLPPSSPSSEQSERSPSTPSVSSSQSRFYCDIDNTSKLDTATVCNLPTILNYEDILNDNTNKVDNNTIGQTSSSGQSNKPLSSQISTQSRPKLFGGLVNRIRHSSLTATNSVDSSGAIIMDSNTCGRCKKLEDQLITLNHDRFALEDEMKTNREVIKILQEQLRIFNSEKVSFNSKLDSGASGADFDSLSKELINLKIQCSCLQKDNQKLSQENKKLHETKSVLEEMLESRDRTLVSLTHEVYDLESKNSRMRTRAELEREYLQDEMPRKVLQRIEQLEDTVAAFEQQNEFLNKEIIELNEIRHRLELKDKQSQGKICEVEARCSQIQSKLLSLLKELNQCIQEEKKCAEEEFHGQGSSGGAAVVTNDQSSPKTSVSPFFVTNESVKLLVNRLLEESSLDIPLSWKPGNRSRNSTSTPAHLLLHHQQLEYDELGFYIRPSEDPNDAEIKSYDLVLEPDKNEVAWRSKWDQFISNLSNSEENFLHTRQFELKQMLRLGVPQDYRCKIWRMLINQRVREKRARLGENYYESLLRASRSFGSPSKSTGSGNSSGGNIVTMTTSVRGKIIDPAAKQIELDLLRTLPNNRHFEALESDGIARLRRVLLAYSLHNQTVGYCQGLNRLAAVALLFMPEEDAFWCLVAIVESIMPPDYYGRNLMGAHVDQYVLRDLIVEKLPTLSQHMETYHIEISLFAWFLTVFVDNIPTSVYLHIWDVFLYEGSKVLFRFALAILRMHEHELLALTDSASFNQFLRTLDERQFNLKRLSEIAFRELNPFSSRLVRTKRTHYTTMVTEELRKIEQIRDSISVQQSQSESRANKSQKFDCEEEFVAKSNSNSTRISDTVVVGSTCTTTNTTTTPTSTSTNKINSQMSQLLISFDDLDSD